MALSRRLGFHRPKSAGWSGIRCMAAMQQPSAMHVMVVGGGAAGLTAAYFAAREGAKVTVLERTSKCGTKILMSGGTRCNVLPVEVDLQRDFFTGGSASAMRAVFASWPLGECKAWLEDSRDGVGLALEAEVETLKYFPRSNSSKEVRDKLVQACSRLGVTFLYNASVEGIRPVASMTSNNASPPGGGATSRSNEAPISSTSRSGSRSGSDRDLDLGPSTSAATKKGESSRRVDGEEVAQGTLSAPGQGWICELKDGTRHRCDRLVVASGGFSFPGVGTDGTGHRLLRRLGHEIRETYPALTPLTGPHPAGLSLAGLSLYNVEMFVQRPAASAAGGASPPGKKAGGSATVRSKRTDMLFTHKGFSGPAVLDLSHFLIKAGFGKPMQQQQQQQQVAAAVGEPDRSEKVRDDFSSDAMNPETSQSSRGGSNDRTQDKQSQRESASLHVSWTGEHADVWEERLKVGGLPLVATVLRRHGIRERLADALCEELGLVQKKMAQLSKAERTTLVAALTRYPLQIEGSEGYKKAEVTGGGLPLEQIDCKTMESKVLPNMYLCGEVLDVFGRIGGFNFYWAWVSGRLAGLSAALGSDQVSIRRALADQRDLWGNEEWKESDW